MAQDKKGQAGASLLDYVLLVACISFIAIPALSDSEAIQKPYMCAAEAIVVAGGGTATSMAGPVDIVIQAPYDGEYEYTYCDSLNVSSNNTLGSEPMMAGAGGTSMAAGQAASDPQVIPGPFNS